MSTTTSEQLRALAAVAQVSLATVGDGDWNPQDGVLERAMLALRDGADELERLRAVIKNAPHGSDAEGRQCELLWREGFRRVDQCTCWKASAL